jgi:hypothetical protein
MALLVQSLRAGGMELEPGLRGMLAGLAAVSAATRRAPAVAGGGGPARWRAGS